MPAPWQTTWEALQRASGLDDLEFKEFVRDCELEFGRTLPTIEGLSSRDAEIYAKDLDHVTQKIFAAVHILIASVMAAASAISCRLLFLIPFWLGGILGVLIYIVFVVGIRAEERFD